MLNNKSKHFYRRGCNYKIRYRKLKWWEIILVMTLPFFPLYETFAKEYYDIKNFVEFIDEDGNIERVYVNEKS